MSFLIDPPWLYANGRAYAALAPERAQGRTAAAVGAATMAGFWAVSVSLYLNRALDEAGLARLAEPTTAATGCSTRACSASTTATRGPAPTRPRPRCSPPTRSCSGSAGGTAADERAGVRRQRHARPLRVLLPARGRPGGRARRLDPQHGAAAARTARPPARSGAPCGTPRPGRPSRSRQTPGARGARRAGSRSRARASGPAPSAAGRPPGRTRAAWDLTVRRRGAAAAPPPPPAALYRPAAAHEAREPGSRGARVGQRRGGRAAARARPLARDDRPQLGLAARRALAVAARDRLRRRARTPGSTSRSGA